MSPCSQELLICRYHDGELDPAARRQVEEHLAGCPACVRHLADLRRLSALLSAAGPLNVTSAETSRMHSAVARVQSKLRDWAFMRIGASMAALAALVLVITSIFLAVQAGGKTNDQGTAEWEATALRPSHALGPAVPDGDAIAANSDLSAWMVRNLGGEPSW